MEALEVKFEVATLEAMMGYREKGVLVEVKMLEYGVAVVVNVVEKKRWQYQWE